MDSILNRAYDPEAFREAGHRLIDQLADHLAAAHSPRRMPAINFISPDQQLQKWETDWTTAPHTDADAFFAELLAGSVNLNTPFYMGHQISAPVPLSALAGLVGDFLNNGMGVYEMGAPATAIEKVVLQIVAKQMGMPDGADGVLTSGGSLANLTALLCARSIKAGRDIWREGDQGRLALLVSEEAHYCVDRAVRIMGWGEGGIIKVPVDDQYRMRTDLLEEYLQAARDKGREVIAVVGSACTTATGSFDNLEAIADFCAKHQLWFHVDGAHGGASVFSKKYRHLVKGIDRADTVAMDFHKMLLTPSVTTALVFRDGRHAFRTFSQKAEYLWEQQGNEEWFNLAKRTFECTKLMLSAKAYITLRTYGPELFDEYVTKVNDLAEYLGSQLVRLPQFELATRPQCNIVCFRFWSPGLSEEELNALNENLRRQLLEKGELYIVQTKLKGRTWLRTTLTNPFTNTMDVNYLLSNIQSMGLQMADQIVNSR